MTTPIDIPALLARFEASTIGDVRLLRGALAETWAQLQESREATEHAAVVERAGIVSDLRHLAGGYEMAGSKIQARTARDLASRYESAGTLALGEMLNQEILKRDAIIHAYAIEGDHCEDDVVRAIVDRQAATITELVKLRDELKSQPVVLAEAERLLRAAKVKVVRLDGPPHDDRDFVELWTKLAIRAEELTLNVDAFDGDTMAHAYTQAAAKAARSPTGAYHVWCNHEVDESDDWRYDAESFEQAVEHFAVELTDHVSWWSLLGVPLTVFVRGGDGVVHEVPLEYEAKVVQKRKVAAHG